MLKASGLELVNPLKRLNKSENPGISELTQASRGLIRDGCEAVFTAFYPDAAKVQNYYEQDAHLIKYERTALPGINGLWRGRFDTYAYNKGAFFTAIGDAQTQGRFVEKPFVDLVSDQTGLWGINLGLGGAGPGHFLKPGTLELINKGRFCIVQVMSGRSSKNVFFDPRTHKNVLRG